MTDIVERLRDWPSMTPVACKEAADEIERLRAELKSVHAHLMHMRRIARPETVNHDRHR